MHFWRFVLLAVALTTAVTVAQSVAKCDVPLGMTDRNKIPDAALSSSSNYYSSLNASRARLDGPSGWCPRPVQTNTMKDYIEVDLRNVYTISQIDLQGRYARGLGNEYTDLFAIEYQTIAGYGWQRYSYSDGQEVFEGPPNAFTTKKTYFTPTFRARKVRIYPMTKTRSTVCLRFELYGCLQKVNEIVISAPTEVETVTTASENCDTVMTLDNKTPPSESVSWCSSYGVYNDMKEWIEMDLGNLRRVTAVTTQGWYDGRYDLTERYLIHYQRVNSDRWIQFTDRQGNTMFRGHRDSYTAVKNILDPAIIVKRMRIIPYDSYGRRVCLTVILHGCSWREAVLSYSMPNGHRFGCADMGTPIFLEDLMYDGQEEAGKLSNGLGQLTDNIEGHSDFTADSGYGKQGYEWIGWNNETLAGSPVEIIFEFDSVREFQRISFHVNNMVSKRVHAFRSATIHFSVGGVNYQDDFVEYNNNARDTLNEQARSIRINIVGQVGRFVKVKLYLDSMWMMLSEVSFDSFPARKDNVFINYM